MKSFPLPKLFIINCFISISAYSQTAIVGTGSSYSNIFPSSTPVTYDVPGGGLASVTLSNNSITASQGIWDLTAQGGANATIAILLVESAAQTRLTGSSLQFGVSNDNNLLLPILTLGTSIHYAWKAEAYFDTPGSELNYTPNTRYNVSFDLDGNNGLLSSIAGLTPSFKFELIDGLGNPLTSSSSGTLINLIGLLGTGVTTGTVSLDYILDGTVPSGPIGMRFTGDSLVGVSALSLGTTYATISNLNITTTPVPEPGGSMLIAAVGLLLLLRRRRLGMA
jgi:hypothetical protein